MRELTSMQAACWIGRTAHAALGSVSAHLYAEFDGAGIDLERLRSALQDACSRHPMLRLRVSPEGLQHTPPTARGPALEVDDLSDLPAVQLQQALQRKREAWTHQQLDLVDVGGLRVGVSLLPENRFRLHVDSDMIAIDPSSFPTLMEDLAAGYEAPEQPASTPPTFFQWLDTLRADPAVKAARDRDRHWWRQRLDHIAPAPTLPLLESSAAQPHSQRLHTWLDAGHYQALQKLARERRLTLSSLMLGLFASVLGERTGDPRFRLNVPSFWRAPVQPQVQGIIGEFANVLIVYVEMADASSPATLCRQLGDSLIQALEHCAYSGVDLMRDLSRHTGSAQLAPVVFTAALERSQGELFSERVRRAFGPMNWVISQGPQVALDVQVAHIDQGLSINWDIRVDALPLAWVSPLFERFVARVQAVAADPTRLDQPLSSSPARRPLNALQQAYLLGRGAHMPLGGVAMQEFREYRGHIDTAVLRARLADMVRRHPSLRTHIDAQRCVQYVSDVAEPHLDEIDLRHLPLSDGLREVEERREAYAHAVFGLHAAPWNVTLFELAQDQHVVFVRMDALIVDGHSIAALLVELFTGTPEQPSAAAAPLPAPAASEQRKGDMAYWRGKLAAVSGPPCLPWKRPLAQAGPSRYQRQSLQVPQSRFAALSRRAAQQRLFKNSALMAVVLEVLSHWLDEGDLCVALPVAPTRSADLANHSSFIAINWIADRRPFTERAKALQVDVLEGLQHLAFSGVDLTRLLFERHGPGPVLPVVITSGLSWPVTPADSAMGLHGGLTQTPQVAMDIRLSTDAQGSLRVDIDYAHEVMDSAQVSDILRMLDDAVSQIAAHDSFTLETAPLLDTAHYRRNSPERDACQAPFLAHIAEQVFDADNTRTALICGSRRLSYAELGDGVARVIAALQARGLTRGHVVAICLPRSPEHTMLTLACALTGVIWVPIDAQAPEQRRRYLLDNCQPDLVVLADLEPVEQPMVIMADLLARHAPFPVSLPDFSLSEAPAYYLYTSGTTGQPKCVVLNNRATANVIGSTLARWQVSQNDVLMSVTPLHHDMSLFDVFGSLSAGATLVLPAVNEDKDAVRWNQLIAEHRVSLWCSVPAIVEMLLAGRGEHDLRSLRLIAQGGDYIKPVVIAQLRECLPHARLISLGGPTETTIWSIWHEIGNEDRTLIPYGEPLPGNRYLLLDDHGRHCPPGVVGRIHTAGVNLALGYLEGGEYAQTDFITVGDEQGHPIRAFRSGDRGRYRSDGTLIFDSRVNGYVKVRGVRVSLPDVEKVLSNHPALCQVLVVDYQDSSQGETNLGVLYVSAAGMPPVSVVQVRNYAREHLQPSHLPTRLLAVNQLPLSQNGKVDRRQARALLAVPATESSPAADTLALSVLQVYLSVLGRPAQHADDVTTHFISLGLRPQHLKAIAAGLRERFAVTLSPGQLLQCRNAHDVQCLLAKGAATLTD
ncbi:D-alanine--D-alanyl carrier protein ligase [Pseudomonas sp. MM227]|uniref:amino acid adenylation domain-containing protein n=1 Tax=Pseudomonas sp. MM227 TaxID=3019968 RepID=UPI00221FAACC|nr:amino acid adenylation domain-containing protein [Pseudomonas sp. MM227]CAI3788063.1 D-alanine--D-alanyl carrier protein ligase [Pseudomonas sp. MM227]